MEEGKAKNLLLQLMVFLENVHVFNCRSERRLAFKVPLSNNWLLIIGVLAAQGIYILSLYLPVTQHVLHVSPVPFNEWMTLLFLASIILATMELFKLMKKTTSWAPNTLNKE